MNGIFEGTMNDMYIYDHW